MKFLIDADSPYSLKDIFIKHGHEAFHVRDVGLIYANDEIIFEYAVKNNFIIVTRDLGFADIFLKRKGKGLILIRLPNYFTAKMINEFFYEFLKGFDVNELTNSITVVELERYRIRKLK